MVKRVWTKDINRNATKWKIMKSKIKDKQTSEWPLRKHHIDLIPKGERSPEAPNATNAISHMFFDVPMEK